MNFNGSRIFIFDIFRKGKESSDTGGNAKGRRGRGMEVGELFELGEMTEDVLVYGHLFGKTTGDVVSNQGFEEGKVVTRGEGEGGKDIIRGDDGGEKVRHVVRRGRSAQTKRGKGDVSGSLVAHVSIIGCKNPHPSSLSTRVSNHSFHLASSLNNCGFKMGKSVAHGQEGERVGSSVVKS